MKPVSWTFWLVAALWLPLGVATFAFTRFGMIPPSDPGNPGLIHDLVSLSPAMLGGLPLAVALRRIWQLKRIKTAYLLGAILGPLAILAATMGGLLGPIGVILYPVIFSLPAIVAAAWLTWRQRRADRNNSR